MSFSKSSKAGGKKTIVRHSTSGQFVVRKDRTEKLTHGRESFPANRALKQGEMPKR